MSKTLRDMLVGVILGDAHIRKTGLDKAYITFEQSSKKAEYIQHLQNLAQAELPLMEEGLKEYSRDDSRYNSTNKSLYFRTQSLENLRPLADLFLDDSGKKVIPANIADYLTPRGLAFWIIPFFFSLCNFYYLSYFNLGDIEGLGLFHLAIIPAITYSNADTLKDLAIKENRGQRRRWCISLDLFNYRKILCR